MSVPRPSRDGAPGRAAAWILAGAFLAAGCASAPPAPRAPAPPPGGEVFHAALTPFGTWARVPGVGTVWRPAPEVVGPAFKPYVTHGRWVWSQGAWVYASDFAWGWATFHYGRWFYSSSFGWQWAPDSEWAPAWVDWRVGGGHVAWAPTPPRGFDGRPRGHVVELRQFTARNLLLHEVEEGPRLAELLEPIEAPLGAESGTRPTPPSELVAAAIGRAVPEPSRLEARREAQARVAFAPSPAPAARRAKGSDLDAPELEDATAQVRRSTGRADERGASKKASKASKATKPKGPKRKQRGHGTTRGAR